jgi:hypothetical protein
MLKEIGKSLGIDYAVARASAGARALGLRIGRGVAVSDGMSRYQHPDARHIDIVIPVIDKDAATLPLVIKSARAQILHDIERIHLIAPASAERIKAVAAECDCNFVEEASLLPFGKKDIRYHAAGFDRSGWLYQQLLKWASASVVGNEDYLILDADTIFLRSQAFFRKGRFVCDFSDERYPAYRATFRELTGMAPACPVSFVSHHGLVRREILAELLALIEARSGKPWYEAILERIDPSEMSFFSEYETYGQYLFATRPKSIELRHWNNKSLPRECLEDIDDLSRRLSSKYVTLSLHHKD